MVEVQLMSFLCWIDRYATSLVCKSLRGCKQDFKKVVEQELKRTHLQPDRVFQCLKLGMCITGSFLHQCIFGVRYPGADIDFIMSKKERPFLGPEKKKPAKEQRRHILDVLNPEGSADRPSFFHFGCNGTVNDYQRILPCINDKYQVVPKMNKTEWKTFWKTVQPRGKPVNGEEWDDYKRRLAEYMSEQKQRFHTLFEFVHVRNMTVSAFIQRFTDISFCKLYFDHRGLHVAHLDDLFTRSFVMNWDLERYKNPNPTMAVDDGGWTSKYQSATPHTDEDRAFLRARLNMRCLKYQARGFTCRNLHEFPQQ